MYQINRARRTTSLEYTSAVKEAIRRPKHGAIAVKSEHIQFLSGDGSDFIVRDAYSHFAIHSYGFGNLGRILQRSHLPS